MINRRGGKVRKFQINNSGYLQSTFSSTDGASKTLTLHKIVWEAFNGPVPDGYEIDHIDEDRLNCALDNLHLLTHEQNVEKARAKAWKFINPAGNVVDIFNLNKFCKEQNLDPVCMMKVSSGKHKQHKGWRNTSCQNIL